MLSCLPPRGNSWIFNFGTYGGLWYRLLLDESLDQEFAERLIDLVLNGLNGK